MGQEPGWWLEEPRVARSAPLDALPADGGDGEYALAAEWLLRARITGLTLHRPEVRDLRLDECDVSGVFARDFIARRLQLTGTRLRQVGWTGGLGQDLRVDGCVSEGLSLRMSTLQRCVFRGCQLTGADFYAVTFDKVRFEDCDLNAAVFDQARVRELRMVNCDLAGVSGASCLAGAEIDLTDLPALAPSLAREAGIRIRDPNAS